ncbi:MAG TPA: hypothetical protein VIJ42_07525 [Stellaceae bacterium]
MNLPVLIRSKPRLSRLWSARAIGLVAAAALAAGAFAVTPAMAADHHGRGGGGHARGGGGHAFHGGGHGYRGGGHAYRGGGGGHWRGGGGGYYAAPPVVYGGYSPNYYYGPDYYAPPPVAYGPGIGVNLPGVSIGIGIP